MLEISDIRKRFGAVEALAGCAFPVKRGPILGIRGPNGAGRTMRVILGLVEPDLRVRPIIPITPGTRTERPRGAAVRRPRRSSPFVIATALLCYLAFRPRMLRWGATKAEAAEPLPGDELCPQPRVQSTRAITIQAPPEQVWPWIVQMGIERAGFYTHDWFERLLFHARYVEGKHSATRIHPELQGLKVGDLVPYGGGAYARVHALEPNRHLVHGEAWVLRPLPGGRTRLLARSRGLGYITAAVEATGPDAPRPTRALAFLVLHVPAMKLVARAFDFFVSDPLHHYMETGMLRGIQERSELAERAGRSLRR